MNDARAKKVLSDYLISEGYNTHLETENYSFDLKATKDNNEELFEVEVKLQWGETWNPTWVEIRIPERKQRLIDLWKKDFPHLKFTFVILNTTLEQGWFIPANVVDESRVGTIQNSKRIGEPHLKEPFFHIPMQKAERKFLTGVVQ
jgi:hypothetical protein